MEFPWNLEWAHRDSPVRKHYVIMVTSLKSQDKWELPWEHSVQVVSDGWQEWPWKGRASAWRELSETMHVIMLVGTLGVYPGRDALSYEQCI